MPKARDEAGNIWEVDAQGNPVRLLQPAQEQMPADPTYPYEGPKAAADAQRAQAEAVMAGAQAPYASTIAQAEAEKAKAEAEKAKADARKTDAEQGVTMTAAERSNAIRGYQSAIQLDKTIADLEQLFEQGPGSTSGLSGALDYAPLEINQRFDRAAQAARGTVGDALGFTGGQLNSAAEAQLNLGAYIPASSDRDETIRDSIRRLKELRDMAKRRSIAILGGVPDENGRVTPVETGRDGLPVVGPGNQGGGGQGGNSPIPVPGGPQTQMVAESNWDRMTGANDQANEDDRYYYKEAYGAFPEQFEQASAFLNSRLGGEVPTEEEVRKAWADAGMNAGPDVYADIKEKWANGRPWVSPSMEGARERAMEKERERMRSQGLDGTFGAIAGGSTDAASLGFADDLVGMFNEDAGRRLRLRGDIVAQDNPGAYMGGQVLGGFGTGAGIYGAASRIPAAARIARGLQGSRAGRMTLAAGDGAVYGAGYGAGSAAPGESRLAGAMEGAAIGAPSGMFGRAATSAIGRGMRGVKDKSVQYLTERGVPLTLGQTLGNSGVAGRMMNKLESLPVVGDMVAASRPAGFRAFEREALRDAVGPVEGAISEGGAEGLKQAQNIRSDAYSDALNGVHLQADRPFVESMTDIAGRGSRIPTMSDKIGYTLTDEIGPLFGQRGFIDGDGVQQAFQTLRGARSDFASEGRMGQNAANIMGEADNAVADMVRRQSPGTMERFGAAQQVHSNLAPIEDAFIRAQRSNQDYITPHQLASAVTNSTQKFGGRSAAARGDRMTPLIRAGQEVLPSSVPNSGSADRGMAALVLPAALGGSAIGLEAYSDNPTATAALATLAALSTKQGQKAAQAAMVKRPQAMRRAGSRLLKSRSRGMFGAPAVPLLLPAD